MLIHPWDAASDAAEWQNWLAATDRFGMLGGQQSRPRQGPADAAHPLHSRRRTRSCYTWPGPTRSGRIWRRAAEVRLAVIGDYAYIPSYWRAKAGGPDEDGVPTSYYSAVQFVCRPTIVDEPEDKVEILTAQLGDLQPEGGHAPVAATEAAVRPDAGRYPRPAAGGAAGGGQVQVRRPQPSRASATRHRQSRTTRPRPGHRCRGTTASPPGRDRRLEHFRNQS